MGGSTPSRMARTQKIASIAPAAPSVWPVIDFVEETATSYACFPKTALIAVDSEPSFACVEVPCAFR